MYYPSSTSGGLDECPVLRPDADPPLPWEELPEDDDELPEEDPPEDDELEPELDEWELELDDPELEDDDPVELESVAWSSAFVIFVTLVSLRSELLLESNVPVATTTTAAAPTIRIMIAKTNIMKFSFFIVSLNIL